jgi:hypothetical protein
MNVPLRKVETLLKKLGVNLVYKPSPGFSFNAFTRGDDIQVTSWRDECVRKPELRWVLLHELGHITRCRQSTDAYNKRLTKAVYGFNTGEYRRCPKILIKEEKEAWRIARAFAKTLNPSADDWDQLKYQQRMALSGYESYGNERLITSDGLCCSDDTFQMIAEEIATALKKFKRGNRVRNNQVRGHK